MTLFLFKLVIRCLFATILKLKRTNIDHENHGEFPPAYAHAHIVNVPICISFFYLTILSPLKKWQVLMMLFILTLGFRILYLRLCFV